MHAMIFFMEKIPPIFFEAHCCLQVLAKLAAYKKGIVVWHLEKGPLRYILKQRLRIAKESRLLFISDFNIWLSLKDQSASV